jgi:hypothetical protein
MATGIKKLQRIQFSRETVAGTAVPAKAIWRGTGNQLDDQRKVNKVEEMIGILTDTTRTNISQFLGMISLNSCNATYEQLPILFAAAVSGQTVATFDGTPAGSGAVLTPVLTSGVITSVTVTTPGSGYVGGPVLLVYGGGGSGAVLTANLTSGAFTSVTVNNGGSGYTSVPTIFLNSSQVDDAIYTYTLPTGTAPVAASGVTYTIYGGDNFEVEVMEYAVCTKIELSGSGGGEVKVSADFMGRQVARVGTAFPAGSSFPNPVEDILFQKGKVFLDAVNGSFGGTQVNTAITGFKVTFDFKWQPVFTADNILYYSFPNFTSYDVKGEVTYIHDTAVSGSAGAKAFYRAQTPKLLRLDFTGSSFLANPGPTYTSKRLLIDLPLTFSKASVLGDDNGTSTVTMTFDAAYDPTAGTAGKVIIVSGQFLLAGL